MGWNDINENASKEKTPYTKFTVGNNMFRILGDEPYSYWSHWLQKQQTSVACAGRDCPICNLIKAAKEAGETPAYNSTKRHAILVWNYTTNQAEIMIQGKTFFNQLLDLHQEVGDIRSYDIKVIRKGKGTDTTYTILPQPAKEFDREGKNIPEVNFAELFAPPTHEEMLQLIEGKTRAEINGKEEK